ncbi:hypothetical protein I5M27_11975 [Adhaeribacter sp. BT258]|uniref:HmuY protein n=1 Tax=Adhaeribacter terrigena TaxID=2793070 RepID=A0ABS1C2S8_9BACT|nr:hypothetical protein [Adhaeribacter terrigena]MBK0403708.1 hypothetical protein [Adhaeribacter terrigena]
MKNAFLLFLFCFLMQAASGQSRNVSKSYCNCLETETGVDSVKFKRCFTKVLEKSFVRAEDEAEKLELARNLDIELQKSCAAYVSMLDRLKPVKGDWVLLKTNPETKLTNDVCQQLTGHRQLFYIEGNGDTTRVALSGGTWQETVGKAKHVSRLDFKPKDNCEFVLTFQESTDPNKGKFSRKGDQYKYRILDKTASYYVATASYGEIVYQFKLYFN